ncbi:MAG: BON domain-containing protein [Pirellulales bacterium]
MALGSDQETAQSIADSIRQSGRLKDYSIGVKYENGTATLMGRVANDQQAAAAVEMAEQLPGITSVVNSLEIKPTAKKDFAVEPTAHQTGSSRRSTSRDDMAFGGTNVQAPAPEYVPQAPAQPAARRVSYNAGIGHHHAARNAGGYVSGGEVMQSSGYNTGAPIPVGVSTQVGGQRVAYDQPNMPCYAWPSYACAPELRSGQLPDAVLGLGLAVHRSVLSVSASSARLAESDHGMERRLVVARLQRHLPALPLPLSGSRLATISRQLADHLLRPCDAPASQGVFSFSPRKLTRIFAECPCKRRCAGGATIARFRIRENPQVRHRFSR